MRLPLAEIQPLAEYVFSHWLNIQSLVLVQSQVESAGQWIERFERHYLVLVAQ